MTTISFPALGTTAQMTLADEHHADEATALMRARLAEIDRAASRFRPDSELMLVQAMGGGPRRISSLLAGAVHAALAAARGTDGLVDPTVGAAIRAAGYDRDFADLPDNGRASAANAHAVDWTTIGFDPRRRLLDIPAGVELDLGATAKALMADRIARELRLHTGAPVLVNLGGDVAVAGGGWDVGIAEDHSARTADQVVHINTGGVATSSTVVRNWTAGGQRRHHIIDPATGEPADTPWRTVTVAARTCLAANTASTAAMVMGDGAPAWLAEHGVAARLVATDSTVVRTGGWPA
ncbi:MAG: FAD:protein transferase [Thermoleophilaceae bacterium]|nr:FAD:protein transferase [Thermoleophilaceae bacterium]